MGLPVLSAEEKKELKAQQEKEQREAQQAANQPNKTKPMSGRESAEHESDDKESFNSLYEEAGLKKFMKKLFNIKKGG